MIIILIRVINITSTRIPIPFSHVTNRSCRFSPNLPYSAIRTTPNTTACAPESTNIHKSALSLFSSRFFLRFLLFPLFQYFHNLLRKSVAFPTPDSISVCFSSSIFIVHCSPNILKEKELPSFMEALTAITIILWRDTHLFWCQS